GLARLGLPACLGRRGILPRLVILGLLLVVLGLLLVVLRLRLWLRLLHRLRDDSADNTAKETADIAGASGRGYPQEQQRRCDSGSLRPIRRRSDAGGFAPTVYEGLCHGRTPPNHALSYIG